VFNIRNLFLDLRSAVVVLYGVRDKKKLKKLMNFLLRDRRVTPVAPHDELPSRRSQLSCYLDPQFLGAWESPQMKDV